MLKTKTYPGFTLIELMVVIVLAGTLASIAIPGYHKAIQQTRRTDAKTALLSLQQAQEKYRANCNQYATALNPGKTACEPGGAHELMASDRSSNGYYLLSIDSADAGSYQLTATQTGTQTHDSDCKTLSISKEGEKTATNSLGQSSTNCW